MDVGRIRTEAEYEAALARLEQLMDAQPGTPEGDALDSLSTRVEEFEALKFPVEIPGPIEAIRFRMEQQGLKDTDFEPYIGPAPAVSAVLDGKRPLDPAMIQRLHEGLGIPAEVLMKK